MQLGKIGVNTLAQLVGKLVSAGAMFGVSLLVARNFGAEGYGDFTKITTYIAFYYLLADFGLNAIYLQQHKQNQGKNLWPSLLGLRVSGSLLLTFIALAILSFLPQGTHQGYTALVRFGIILFSPAILFQALITTTNALFQKHLRYELSTLAIVAGSVTSLVLVFLASKLVSPTVGSVFASLALLVGAAVTGVSGLVLVRSLREPVKLAFELTAMRKLVLASFPLGLMLLFNQVYFRFDSFVLTLTRSTTEVGIYGLAYKVFEIPLVLPTFFMNATYPLMLKVKPHELLHLIRRALLFLLLASLLLVVVFWFSAPFLALVRPEFSLSIPALRILVLGLPFFFVTSLLLWVLVTLGKQKLLPIIYGLSMFLIIVLDILFIPRFGYVSAAWITVATEGVVLLLLGLVVTQALF